MTATTMSSVNKITTPRIKGILHRERLYQGMDQSLERPVVWVNGEGGAGKSTFVAGYLHHRSIPCIWYQIDQGDADPATFFSYMSRAAEALPHHPKTELPQFSPEYFTGLATFSRRFFERLFVGVPRPFVLVLDDYQEVPHTSAFHDVIASGLFEVPEGVNVITISRSAPPQTMVRLRSLGNLAVTSRSALRFTRDETRELLKLRKREASSAKTVNLLHEKTHGWAAGLVLMMDCSAAELSDMAPASASSLTVPEEIFEYFYAELFAKIPVQQQDFFLKTAFFKEIIPEAAEKLTGLATTSSILADLHAQNYFTERREHAYRYHPLFREFLLRQAAALYPARQFSQIRYTAAGLQDEFGRSEEAALLYGEGAHWPELVRIIRRESDALVSQGRQTTVLGWLNSLPKELLADDPHLLFQRGACLALFDPTNSKNDLVRAFELYKDREEWAGMLLSWSAIMDLGLFMLSDPTNASFPKYWQTYVPLVEDTLEQHPEFHNTVIEAKVTLSLFNALFLREVDAEQQQKLLRKTHSYFEVPSHSDLNQRIQTGVYLAVHYLWAGESVAAYDILCRLMQLVDGASVSDLMQITVKTTEALYLFFVGDCISAGKRVDEALEMAEKSGVHIWDNHVMLHGIAAALGAEQMEKAESLVARFSKSIENISFLNKAYFFAMLSWKAKLEGNIDQTYNYLVHIHDLFERMIQVATRVVGHCFFAEALFLKGSLDEANCYLQKAYDIGRGMQSKLVHFMCLLLDAQMRLRQGDELRGLELLRQAFQLGRECTITNFYGWHAPTMSYLCCKALEHNIEPEYVRKLIATRHLMPDELPLDLDGWDWPIRVYTLGRFSIALQGKEAAFSRKPKNKQMELLKLLISQGEPGTTEEKIRDLLWPDSDGDKGRNLLKVTLHRLRELLGSENAIRLREGRLFIDKRVVWIDAWAFEYSFVKVRAKGSVKTTNQLLKVIDLYQGDFLADECESFRYSAALRERLRNMHASILKQLVDDGMAEDQLQTVLHCCRKAHEVNPLSEPICQLLMRLEEKTGLRSEALRTYDRCKKMLADELGSAPSPATQALYKTIRDGKSDLP